MRRWSLIRMEYCPLRFPFRASNRLELSAARSPSDVAAIENAQTLLRLAPERVLLTDFFASRETLRVPVAVTLYHAITVVDE